MEIVHTLDLALRLIDTTSGRPITQSGVVLRRDGEALQPMAKGDGCLVLLGQSRARADFVLDVEVPGFEPRRVQVCYAALDPALPLLDLHLIPGPRYRAPWPCLTLEGALEGITSLCAVRDGDSACLIRDFDPRRRRITLFNPHRLDLERVHYALVDPDAGRFEPFDLLQRVSDQVFRTDRVLETSFGNYFPVTPVVVGMAEGGRYRLRVRDDAAQARWILRWTVGEEPPSFKTVDFRQPETLALP